MDIMFDQQYMVMGDEVPIKLGFKDVIFVMEDVDAASKVVQRRDGKTGVVARLEDRRAAALSPEEKALLVGGVEATSPQYLPTSPPYLPRGKGAARGRRGGDAHISPTSPPYPPPPWRLQLASPPAFYLP